MDNYQFCAQWVVEQAPSRGARILDYGCGAGQIVKELRSNQLDAFGSDIFYEGKDYSIYLEDGLLGNIICKMEGGKIPFDQGMFDFVINNQVMEHVNELDKTLAEIYRVMKPGGKILSLFPDRSVWREGHCGIPFLHWFQKGSKVRLYYAAALRSLGLGYNKGGKSIMRWSQDYCDYLDKWTHYRDCSEIKLAYEKYFFITENIEDYWLLQRLGKWKFIVYCLPAKVRQLLVRKGCGLVFVAVKPSP